MGKDKLICITKNDWHYKLIKFTWGIDPSMFKNLCPYFWLTIASIFVSPFVAVFKMFVRIFMLIGKAIGKILLSIYNSYEENSYKSFLDTLDESQIYYMKYKGSWRKVPSIACSYTHFEILHTKFKNIPTEKMLNDVMKRRNLTHKEVDSYSREFDTKFDCLKKIREQKEYHYRLKREKSEKQAKQMKYKMYKIAESTKMIFKFIFTLLIGTAILFVTTCLIDLLCFIFSIDFVFNWSEFWKASGCIVGSFVLTTFVNFFIGCSEKWWSKKEILTKRQYYYVVPLWIIYLPLRFIVFNFIYKIILRGFFYKILWQTIIFGIGSGFAEGITEFGGIFGNYLNASYSDYCPMINWEKEK